MAHVIPNTNPEIDQAIANGLVAMIEGQSYVTAGKAAGSTLGTKATAEGNNNTASGNNSHAGGQNNTASGTASVAMGSGTTASAAQATAIGSTTVASGGHSVAAGYLSVADGNDSSAIGTGTKTTRLSQFAFGAYNEQDPSTGTKANRGKYIAIAGNGNADNDRSNAMTLDWEGNETLAGKLTIGVRGSNSMDAATLADAYAAYVTETESGDIVTFSDGADGIPVKAFTGSIIPSQNLSGQSAPYPAGGNKNKFDADTAYASYKTAANTYVGTGSQFNGINVNVPDSLIGVECTFSAYLSPASGASNVRVAAKVDGADVRGDSIQGGASGYSAVTFTPTAGTTLRVSYGSGGSLSITVKDVQLETGSSRTAWVPYSNICPISGWTGAEIYRTGINVWDEAWELGTISSTTGANVSGSSNIRSTNYIPVKPNTTYYYRNGLAKKANLRFYGLDKSFIGAPSAAQSASTTFTTPDGCYFMRFYCVSDYGTTYSDNISFNFPATETAYHAHEQAQTIILTFGDTVYAGNITALGGGKWSIQPTDALIDMGDITWTYDGANLRFRGAMPDIKDAPNRTLPIVCSCYMTIDDGRPVTSVPNCSIYATGGDPKFVFVHDTAYSSADTFKTAVTGQTLVYPLATLPDPIIVSGEDLQTLLGANTAWTDCGSVTGMTYRADTKLYIQKMIS